MSTTKQHLTPENIQKYQKKTLPWLMNKAGVVFRKWIRERDRDGSFFTCISCGQTKKIVGDNYQAGHYYSAGEYSGLKFHEWNVHGQCKACNYFKSGNLIPYRTNMIAKIGEREYGDLVYLAARYKRHGKKWTRFDLIEIIEKYKL